jgi:hypothetical protein
MLAGDIKEKAKTIAIYYIEPQGICAINTSQNGRNRFRVEGEGRRTTEDGRTRCGQERQSQGETP